MTTSCKQPLFQIYRYLKIFSQIITITGFAQVLQILESIEFLVQQFPALERPGKPWNLVNSSSKVFFRDMRSSQMGKSEKYFLFLMGPVCGIYRLLVFDFSKITDVSSQELRAWSKIIANNSKCRVDPKAEFLILWRFFSVKHGWMFLEPDGY